MASGAAKNLAIRYLPFAIRLSRSRPGVALDHDDVGDRAALALRLRRFVLGRVPAGERRLVGGKLDHDVAAARLALDGLVLAAADEEASAELREGDAVRRDVVLVGVGILDVDMGDPIALRHDLGPLDRDDVGAAVALALLDRTAAHERLAAVFADRLGGVLDVLGVLLGVRHDNAGDDVAFGHS